MEKQVMILSTERSKLPPEFKGKSFEFVRERLESPYLIFLAEYKGAKVEWAVHNKDAKVI